MESVNATCFATKAILLRLFQTKFNCQVPILVPIFSNTLYAFTAIYQWVYNEYPDQSLVGNDPTRGVIVNYLSSPYTTLGNDPIHV